MQEIMIFGASNMGKSAYYALKSKYKVLYFTDNNKELWQKRFDGIEIIPPYRLKELSNNEIIIASIYYKEIINQIFEYGFDYAYIYNPLIENNFMKGIRRYNINFEIHGSESCRYAICPRNISSSSIVYSFGIGEDVSFDISLINKYGLKVYAFDPTPKSKKWISKQSLPDRFYFYDLGISDVDGVEKFYLPEKKECVSCSSIIKFNNRTVNVKVNKIDTIAAKLKHSYIDIIKMDIEGSEYKVIKDILKSNIIVKQIVVEFHHRFNNVGYGKTTDIIKEMKQSGYKLFHVSQSGEEFSFILSND